MVRICDLITLVSKLLSQLLHPVSIFLLQIFTSALMFQLDVLSQPLQPRLLPIIINCSLVCAVFLKFNTQQTLRWRRHV